MAVAYSHLIASLNLHELLTTGGAARAGRLLTMILFLLGRPASVHADFSVAASASLALDNYGYRWDEYQAELRRKGPADGQWIAARLHGYSLDEELAGIQPFDGYEPAAELGGFARLDHWWLSAAAGFQGRVALEAVVGRVIMARAIPLGEGAGALTPRVEAAREPLAISALPLSLGMFSYRGEALIAFRGPGFSGEGGARVAFWEREDAPGRTRNPALDRVETNRVTTVHSYVLSDFEHWLNAGFSAKAGWSERNTMLYTGFTTEAMYTWYPAFAPPFLWETALIVQAAAQLADPLDLLVQLHLPAASQETRQWETVRRTFWGTAPFEAELQTVWSIFETTRLSLKAAFFAKPWEHWDVISPLAYRQGSVLAAMEQRL